MRAEFLILCFAAGALILGPIRTGRMEAEKPPQANPGPKFAGTFIEHGTFQPRSAGELPKGLQTRGSWVGGDSFTGECSTAWTVARGKAQIFVSGYPHVAGNTLYVETKSQSGERSKIPFEGKDPGEHWEAWEPPLPAGTEEFRIVAADTAATYYGWLAISEPFLAQKFPRWKQALAVAQLLGSFSLALCVICGPGLLWIRRHPDRPMRWIEAILPGPLLLASGGVLIWVFGGLVSPIALARALVSCLLGFVVYGAYNYRRNKPSASSFTRIALLTALVALLAFAKSSLSIGPKGELFEGTVSRTLSPSGHSDSRISYHLVQVIAHHLSPLSSTTRDYYWPWQLTSRGPLGGLIAAPLVLATGADVPRSMPDQKWSPFDREGFAVYRATLIVLGSLAAWAVAATILSVSSGALAEFGVSLLVLSPFFVHELYFTWPKLIAAAHVLFAFIFIQKRQPLPAGVVLALGYLYHPLAILSAPFLWLWEVRTEQPRTLRNAFYGGALFAAGTAIIIVPWLVLDKVVVPHDSPAGQHVFLSYFTSADNRPATLATWVHSRWSNFAYTFVPFYFFSADFGHESLNSVYGVSDRWLHFAFVYWNTLPFALGLPSFIAVAVPGLKAIFRHPLTSFILFVGPSAFLIVYWGAASTGLMRHCGHTLFLTAICGAVWTLSQPGVSRLWAQILLHPVFLALRLIELGFVCLGTTLHTRVPSVDSPFFGNDLWFLIIFAVTWIAIGAVALRLQRDIRDRVLSYPSQSA